MHGKKTINKVKTTTKNDKLGEIFIGNIYHRKSNIPIYEELLKTGRKKKIKLNRKSDRRHKKIIFGGQFLL